ncbi:phosphoglycerate kinase [Halobacteriales archaeon QS_8_69_26]|nr:MAG: phosphoglycerate kinase [Halobacteriales archaeon QS_8_69_26]
MVLTLDDLAVEGRTVGVRVDVNSPTTEDGGLADDARLRAHVDTLSELLDRGARVAVLAHQGRPGDDDYHRLSAHADRFDELLDGPVGYVDATFGSAARERIAALDDGEAVLLENTRFYAEEYMEFPPERAARTHLVEGLVDALDVYVNDAFAAAHRSQPSLVGFPPRLPACAGRVMERELDVLGGVADAPRPLVYAIGGAKLDDALDVAWHVLERGRADEMLVTGAVGNVFLFADGVDAGTASAEFIEGKGGWEQVERARDLLDAHGEKIHLPLDVAVDRNGRTELGINALPPREGEAAMDVGNRTVRAFETVLDRAGTVVLNGPAGVFEDEQFRYGTRELFDAATRVEHSVVGGGDTAAAIRALGVEGFSHVSTGGGAALNLLCGEDLPAVEALEAAADRRDSQEAEVDADRTG